jgi:enoyl-CoA hydratase/carnithine racemase
MDPMTIALIFTGIRLLSQGITGSVRAKARLSDFEAYLVALHQEGREPTAAELAGFVNDALEADDGLADAIQRLKDAT